LQADLVVYPYHCSDCFISYRSGAVCRLEDAWIELHENKANDDGGISLKTPKEQFDDTL